MREMIHHNYITLRRGEAGGGREKKNHKLYRMHLIRKWKWLIGLDKTNLALSTPQRG